MRHKDELDELRVETMKWIQQNLKDYDFPQRSSELQREIGKLSFPCDDEKLKECCDKFFSGFDNDIFRFAYGLQTREDHRITGRKLYHYFVHYENADIYIPLGIYLEAMRPDAAWDEWKQNIDMLEQEEYGAGAADQFRFRAARDTFESEWEKVRGELRNYPSCANIMTKKDKFQKSNRWKIGLMIVILVIFVPVIRCYFLPLGGLCAYLAIMVMVGLILFVGIKFIKAVGRFYCICGLRKEFQFVTNIKPLYESDYPELLEEMFRCIDKMRRPKHVYDLASVRGDLEELKRQLDDWNHEEEERKEKWRIRKQCIKSASSALAVVLLVMIIFVGERFLPIQPTNQGLIAEDTPEGGSANADSGEVYIVPDNDGEKNKEPEDMTEEESDPTSFWYQVMAERANIRTEPVDGKEKVISGNPKVGVSEISGSSESGLWYRIRLPGGEEGWMNRKLLKRLYSNEVSVKEGYTSKRKRSAYNFYDGYIQSYCQFSGKDVEQEEEIILILEKETAIDRLILYSGNYNNDDYARYGKISKIEISTDSAEKLWREVDLDTDYNVEGQCIVWEDDTPTDRITIRLKEMEPGTDSSSATRSIACLSEIIVLERKPD